MLRRTLSMAVAISAVAATVGVLAPVARAATPVGSAITEDTTWTLAGSPYVLTNDVTVTLDSTLTIEPGVIVRGAPGARLLVAGALDAVGTEQDNIVFRRDSSTANWGGIVLVGQLGAAPDARTSVQYAIVEFADVGISSNYDAPSIANNVFASNNTALQMIGPREQEVTIADNVFENNGTAITGRAGNVINVLRNDFWNNDVNVNAGPKPVFDCPGTTGGWEIHENDILRGPQNAGFYSNDVLTPQGSADSPYTVDATDNWWGTPDEDRVAGRLREETICCPGDARQPIDWQPVSPAANTAWEPSGEVPDPAPPGFDTHGDPAVIVSIDRPRHGACISADSFTGVAGRGSSALAQLEAVYVAVGRIRSDGLCAWWSKRKETLVRGYCSSPHWFKPRGLTRWSYSFPVDLPRGRYVALASGNRPSGPSGTPGRTEVNFTLTAGSTSL